MPDLPAPIGSVCVYCASSDAADPAYMEAAGAFGKALAEEGLRLVYGGGNIGLMGACARAAHAAGGKVLGVMPEFLRQREILYGDVETIVVGSMHERKMVMFEQSDAFVVLPGGVGTLEEVVEMMSWRRLEVHRKPIVFYSPGGFWEPLYRHLAVGGDGGGDPAGRARAGPDQRPVARGADAEARLRPEMSRRRPAAPARSCTRPS